MPQGRCLLGQVEEVSYQNVDQDVEIISEEVFIGAGSRKNQVQQLECEELQRCLRCSWYQQQNVLYMEPMLHTFAVDK